MTAKAKKRNRRSKRSATYVKHIKASLSYVAPHKHTGKRLAHKHTSHGILLLLLILAGIILAINFATLQAAGITASGSVNVTLTVPTPAPKIGAFLKSPVHRSLVTVSKVDASGTCPSGNIVAVYNNGVATGSTVCSTDGAFTVPIQLQPGLNVLQSQNYDDLNQPGPATDQISVTYDPPAGTAAAPVDAIISPVPQPAASPCYDSNQQAPAGNALLLLVPCVSRNIFIGEKLSLPVTIVGGFAPYALNIDWGDTTSVQLYSFATAGKQTLDHTYSLPELKTIQLTLADSTGNKYQIQSVVQINGSAAGTSESGSSPIQQVGAALQRVWIEASIPVYWAIVALFLGFWVGDIFQRVFGIRRPKSRHA